VAIHTTWVSLADIKDPAAAIEVPEEDIRDYIEEEYLEALGGDEERFLQATSPLTELDEYVCSAVLADEDGFDQVGVRRLLRGLNKRVIVQDKRTGPRRDDSVRDPRQVQRVLAPPGVESG